MTRTSDRERAEARADEEAAERGNYELILPPGFVSALIDDLDAAIRRAEAAEADADELAAALDSGAHWGCTCPWDDEGNPSGYGGEHYPTCKRGQPLTGAAALACHAKAVAERGQP